MIAEGALGKEYKALAIGVLIVMLITAMLCMLGCSNKNSKEAEEEKRVYTEFTWPKSEIAKLIPEPESHIGHIEWEAEYGFVIYVAETDQQAFAKYVDACWDRGFNVDYRRDDTYFYADNADGYHVSLRLDDNDVMFIRLDNPDKEESEAESTTPTEELKETDSENNSSNDSNNTDVDISKLQVSRYEESELDGADSYHVYSNVGASEANLAAFRDDCIISVAHAFNIPISEATTYVDRALAGESRVVIKGKYYSYTLSFEADSITNKQGAYTLDIFPDTIGWLDW